MELESPKRRKQHYNKPFQKEIEKIIIDIANKQGLSIGQVKDIIMSQFNAVVTFIGGTSLDSYAEVNTIRLMYLGKFRGSKKKYKRYVQRKFKQSNSNRP